MPNKRKIKLFNQRIWLNGKDSPSTGSACMYHGPSPWNKRETLVFLEVGDCHQTIRLHQCNEDTKKSFLKKIKRLRKSIEKYEQFLMKSFV